MNLKDYTDRAWALAIYPNRGSGSMAVRSYALAGLLEEIGEFNGKVKRIWREHHGTITEEMRQAMLLELGDVLWYCVALGKETGLDLGTEWPEGVLLTLPGDESGDDWRDLAAHGYTLSRVVSGSDLSVGIPLVFTGVACAAITLLSSIEEVARLNIEKLEGRQERGTLQGQGDDR